MITLTSTYLGWTARKVRVASIGVTREGMVPLTVQEEDSSIYDQSINESADEVASIPIQTRIFDAVTPTGLSAVTGEYEATPNVLDAYINFYWTHTTCGATYDFQYKRVTDAFWTRREIVATSDSNLTISAAEAPLPVMTEYDYQVMARLPHSTSQYASGTVTSYTPATVSTSGVTNFTATSSYFYIVLKWTESYDDPSIKYWRIYRNTTNSITTAQQIARVNNSASTVQEFKDWSPHRGTHYYYWLRAEDSFSRISTDYAGDDV